MNEKTINTIIKKSLFFGYKIEDPRKENVYTSNERPFDGFGVGRDIYGNVFLLVWEAKYSKSLKAFNLKKLAPHQINYLNILFDLKSKYSLNIKILVVYACYVKRSDLRLFIFDWDFLRDRVIKNENIKKKELECLPYVAVKSGKIGDLNIITKEIFETNLNKGV